MYFYIFFAKCIAAQGCKHFSLFAQGYDLAKEQRESFFFLGLNDRSNCIKTDWRTIKRYK